MKPSYDNGEFKLIIEDTGTGMTEEEQQRVFDVFERLSNAAAKEGFGLGLSIVPSIVAMLGGTIRLESEKNRGSRFMVEIPMQTAEELSEQINQAQIHHNHTCHDVIAIDNDNVCNWKKAFAKARATHIACLSRSPSEIYRPNFGTGWSSDGNDQYLGQFLGKTLRDRRHQRLGDTSWPWSQTDMLIPTNFLLTRDGSVDI